MPFSVVRFDELAEPIIAGPPAVTVTPGMVAAIAFRSPADPGVTRPFTPFDHASLEPGSTVNGETLLLARTGLSAVTLTAARRAGSRASVKSATNSRSLLTRCTRRRAERYPREDTYTR